MRATFVIFELMVLPDEKGAVFTVVADCQQMVGAFGVEMSELYGFCVFGALSLSDGPFQVERRRVFKALNIEGIPLK
jgi:hypothetical protein